MTFVWAYIYYTHVLHWPGNMKSGRLTKHEGFTDLYLILLLWADSQTLTMMRLLFQLLTVLLYVFGWVLLHKIHSEPLHFETKNN